MGRRGEQDGATSVEYALMAAFIAMVIIGAVAVFGTQLGERYDCHAEHVEALRTDPGSPEC